MKNEIVLISLLLVGSGFMNEVKSQSEPVSGLRHRRGLTVEFGRGGYAITDENISREKYAGSIPWVGVEWARDHTRNHFRLGFEALNSSSIRNHNVTTTITQVSLHQAFLYPLSDLRLFKRDATLLLGPSTEFFILMNSQDIAVAALGFAQSIAALISVGVRSELTIPLTSRIQAEGSLRAGVLSLAARMVDDERTDEPPARLLTALSGTHVVFRLGIRYSLSERWSCRLAYASDITRISSWNPLLSASDFLNLSLTWGL